MASIDGKPDWEAIEAAFRAGAESIRAIADKHGISDTAIRSHCKKHGITRDLSATVRQATRGKLALAEVKDTEFKTDDQIVSDAADINAQIVMSHRSGLAEWRKIAGRLSKSLSTMKITDENHDKFARSLNAGVDAQLKVIKGERQAYNLDDENQGNDGRSLAELVADVFEE
jgi:transposase-like protein